MANFLSDDSDLNKPHRINFTINDGYDDDNAELKFDLYLMTREIKQITDHLRRITILPRKEQIVWVNKNQLMLDGFMNKLTQDVFENLEEMELDQDALQETIACVVQLRELTNTLRGLMKGPRQLRG